mgnify:CR=1 FL=1
MKTIKIKRKTGREVVIKHACEHSKNSYVKCEGGFAIIRDEWGTEKIFPAKDIEEITVSNA